MALVNAVYNFKNATSKNRYSSFDITDGQEEPDPLNRRYGVQNTFNTSAPNGNSVGFCPYCGEPITKQEYEFCPKCGRELP